MMKKILNEEEIFNKFFTYTYRDVEKVCKSVNNLVVNAVYDSTVCSLLELEGSFSYLAGIIEYITYNSIPVKLEHELIALLCNGECSEDKVKVSVDFCKKKTHIYTIHYIIYLSDEEGITIEISDVELKVNKKKVELK